MVLWTTGLKEFQGLTFYDPIRSELYLRKRKNDTHKINRIRICLILQVYSENWRFINIIGDFARFLIKKTYSEKKKRDWNYKNKLVQPQIGFTFIRSLQTLFILSHDFFVRELRPFS